MKQAEQKGHDPGITDRKAHLTPPETDDLRAEEKYAERDSRVELRKRSTRESQGGYRQSNAVCHGKSTDGLQQHHPPLHNQQQPQDEEQVVDTLQDAMKTEAYILSRSDVPGALTAQLGVGFRWPDDRGHRGAVETVQQEESSNEEGG